MPRPPHITPHWTTKKFPDRESAEQWLENNYAGEAYAKLAWKASGASISGGDEDDDDDALYWARGTIKFHVVTASSRIEMTRVEWPHMTKKEIAERAKMETGLLEHERGHIALAQAVADDKSGEVTGSGEDAEAAADDYNSQIDDIAQQADQDNQAIQAAYDTATKHGLDQHGCNGGQSYVRDHTRNGVYVHAYLRSC